MAYLRDPLWTFVGILLTVVVAAVGLLAGPFLAIIVLVFALIIASLAVYIVQERKEVSYQIVSESLTTSIVEQHELRGQLGATFEHDTLPNIAIGKTVLELTNTGTSPVDADDYADPITLRFNRTDRVLVARPISTTPEGIVVHIRIENENMVIEPLYLEKGQSITVKVLSTSISGKVHGRLKEGKVRQFDGPETTSKSLFNATLLASPLILCELFFLFNPTHYCILLKSRGVY